MMSRSRRGLRVCAVSFKPCWQDDAGRWMSSGGFPLQMSAIGSLFDEMVLVVVRETERSGDGGIPLPSQARVIPLRAPHGRDARRKLSVASRLPYYLWKIGGGIMGADVVHVPLPGDIPLLALMLSLLMRKRTIVRYGGSWPANDRTTAMDRFTKRCMRRFAGGRNVMLATGSGTAAPARGVSWIFSTALAAEELERASPCLDRGLSSPARLVYIGRLSPEKGVSTLLRSLASLVRDGFTPPPRLVLAGDGPQRAELEALAEELGITHLICFLGQLDRDTLSAELSQMDLCVQPSLTEGFSKAWLDAMAHGLPVLASDVGAASSVIGREERRGWLVPPGDAVALRDALCRILSGPVDWPALRRSCRAYVEGKTLEAWAQEIGRQCTRQWNWTVVNGRLDS
ncbi:MAG TPA: glycosyltransferase [Gemmatimonadaceae bacterium]